jgi:hypothetical protein
MVGATIFRLFNMALRFYILSNLESTFTKDIKVISIELSMREKINCMLTMS